MAIYSDQHKPLKDLLAMASNDEGATLLIPDLQRPYIWRPTPVIVLIDSLTRGWPFGTLLTWKVSPDDPARALARAFWKVVDRTNDEQGEVISKKNPPAAFHMVLDGQQRVQSLLLALSGDGWGLKQYDREWNADLKGTRQRGAQGQPHWSLGCLCVNLDALGDEYERAKRRIVAVDFQKVLAWVVTDPATGLSKLPKKPNYTEPLARITDAPGKFVRLSRLWGAAPEQEGIEIEEAEALAEPLLNEHQVPPEKMAALRRPVGSLLTALGRVKRTRVTYLELSEYSQAHGTRDNYNDAIVSIFTRLNTAGRTLTEEDITFAWLKIGWNVGATGGASAARCFEDLRERLEEFELELTVEDLVSAVSFVWAVQFNAGKLLGKHDLLKGEAIRPMAAHISENWALVVETLIHLSAHVRDRRLRFGEHYQSLNAMQFLWAIHFAALYWRQRHSLGELEKDALEKRIVEMLDALADRWLICSGWAGLWASGTAETMSALAGRLASCVAGLAGKTDVAAAMQHLRQHLETEVRTLEQGATDYVAAMKAADRKQVRAYYAALWIWNRLEKNRWEKAKLALREKRRRRSTLDVDHVVAWDLWQTKLQQAAAVPLVADEPPATPDELEQAVNDLGNCLLLEKNFNISKSNKPLKDFLEKIYEFQQGCPTIAEWAMALELDIAQVDSAATPPDILQQLFTARTQKIRKDLEEFVRGNKLRVDLDDLVAPPSKPAEAGPDVKKPKGKSSEEKFKRDLVKIDFMKGLKKHFWKPPLSEKYACWGARGRSYSCFFSIAERDEIYFGLDWDNPYLSVPKDDGYDTNALTGLNWKDDEEDNARWYDFGPVDLGDAEQSSQLIERIIEVLGNIKVVEHAE